MLPLDVLSESRAREAQLKAQHSLYLERHPEIQKILSDLVSATLIEQPADVFEFARKHFDTDCGGRHALNPKPVQPTASPLRAWSIGGVRPFAQVAPQISHCLLALWESST